MIYNNHMLDKPEDFDNLTPDEQAVLKAWIQANLEPRKTCNRDCTSYGLKHNFEYEVNGFYIHNGMFKGAMLACGFHSTNMNELNWCFNITRGSLIALYERQRDAQE